MKRSVEIIVLILALVGFGAAQNLTTVTASKIQRGGVLIPSGKICFLGTDSNDNPVGFRVGGGGQEVMSPYCSAISNGAIVGAFNVANPANTAPANINYRVTVTASNAGVLLTYSGVQFSGATFNFDNYVPSANLPLGASANVLSVGTETLSDWFDVSEIAAPAFPSGGYERWYADSSTHLMSCLTSAGANCAPLSSGSGTVTSVGLALPNIFTVSGSPVTISGTLTGALATQSANTIFAGPSSGSAVAPGFRVMVTADEPATTVNSVTNDTNVTGSIAAQGLTLGWSGTLAKARTLSTTVYTDQNNTYSAGTQDFSAVSQIKLPTAAGYISAANGNFGYDTSAGNWHIFGNGVDNINLVVPAATALTSGDCARWVIATGVITLGDTGSPCGAGGGGSGSVTSVGLNAPTWLSVSGSPVTSSGTIVIGAAPGQPSNQVLGTFGGTQVSLGSLTPTMLPATAVTAPSSLTTNTVPVANAASGLANSSITDNGSVSTPENLSALSVSATGTTTPVATFPTTTVGNLPNLTNVSVNDIVPVSDGSNSTDCSTGGGTVHAWCQCITVTGGACTAWTSIGGGTGGNVSGPVSSITNNLVAFGNTTGSSIVDSNIAEANVAQTNIANSYTAGKTQTVAANATSPGLAFACVAADPSSPNPSSSTGLWCRSDLHRFAYNDGTQGQIIATQADIPNPTPAFISLTDGATITWNASTSTNAKVTLGGNRALNITNATSGMRLLLYVTQDATGSRTLTMPSDTLSSSGGNGAVTLSTAANAVDKLSCDFDGSNFYCAQPTLNFTAGSVATPAYNPAAGTYNNTQSVTITDATSGAAIVYCTDTNNTCTPSTSYSSAVSITSNGTYLRAQATKSGMTNSAVASALYTLTNATPTDSPGGGTYTSSQTVTFSTATTGATLLYTSDGTTPGYTGSCTPSGTTQTYSSALTVSTTTTFKILACKANFNDSTIDTTTYTITGAVTVTVDSGSVKAFNNGTAGTTAPASGNWSFTVPSQSNRLMLVSCGYYQLGNNSSDLITGITYNGTSMANMMVIPGTGGPSSSNFPWTSVWYLKESSLPTGGTAANIVVTLSSSSTATCGAAVLYNVNQTTPFVSGNILKCAAATIGATTAIGGGSSTSCSSTMSVTSATNDLVVDFLGTPYNQTQTPGTGQTAYWSWNQNVNGITYKGDTATGHNVQAMSTAAGASSVGMSWTLPTNEPASHGGVSIVAVGNSQ